jgi:hypothetical protein
MVFGHWAQFYLAKQREGIGRGCRNHEVRDAQRDPLEVDEPFADLCGRLAEGFARSSGGWMVKDMAKALALRALQRSQRPERLEALRLREERQANRWRWRR